MSELFVYCMEMSDTKFVRHQHSGATVRIRCIIVKAITYGMGITMSHTVTSRETVLTVSALIGTHRR